MRAIRAALAKPAPPPAPPPPPKMTFVYITCRKNSRLEWFLDSLYNQIKEIGFDTSNIQLVIVDLYLQYNEGRIDYVRDRVKGRFEFVHVPPKPSPWQGKYRITKTDCFTCALPRNTGVCYAKHPYLFFIDDLSVLAPGSFQHMVEYARRNIVVAFSYKKVLDLNVTDGCVVSVKEHQGGIDCRIQLFKDSFTQISGSSLYGYSASPLDVVLRVNGYDEIHNSMGGEDYNYGIRVERSGTLVYYSKDVLFYETDVIVDEVTFNRRDPLLTEEEYKALMKKHGVTKRWVEGRTDLSHFLLDLLTLGKSWTEGNDYNLAELRRTVQNGGSFPTSFDTELKTIEGTLLKDL